MEENQEGNKSSERPPFLGSWRNIYWLVMGNLAFFILLFYLFTRYFS